MRARLALAALLVAAAGALPAACAARPPSTPLPPPPPHAATQAAPAAATPTAQERCRGARDRGRELTVHFYDVGQALAALVTLPDGRHVLVDTGESPKRAGCEGVCAAANARLLEGLARDLGERPIDLLWITHPHSDHVGGAASVLERFHVLTYVDNGRDLDAAEVKAARAAAAAKGTRIEVVEPGHDRVPLSAASRGDGSDDASLTAIAPSAWLPGCKDDRNECSILLRVDWCASSVLFTGDAEVAEEALVDTRGPVTLLQVGHHGSDTSSGPAFLAKTRPAYAVISAGKPDEGTNRTYCHPRRTTVTALTRALGGPGERPLRAYAGESACRKATAADWVDEPASDRLWATERDGDLLLVTHGDGTFTRAR